MLVNGCPTEEFPLERGLRQGDPLFPFLFIIAVEAFNVMMLEARDNGVLKAFKVGSEYSYLTLAIRRQCSIPW